MEADKDLEEQIKVLRRYWDFDQEQRHTHTWHDREDYIQNVFIPLLRRTPPPEHGYITGGHWEIGEEDPQEVTKEVSEEQLNDLIVDYCNKHSLLYAGCRGLAKAIKALLNGEK